MSHIILTDGGLETDLIFNKHIELEHFAAFPLIENNNYRRVLISYYKEYMELAKKHQTGFILESPTWRANLDWGKKLGYTETQLVDANKGAIGLMYELKSQYQDTIPKLLVSGQIGPRGDGYVIGGTMTNEEAANYHDLQVKAFNEVGIDMVTAITMTYIDEALGIVNSAQNYNVPVVVSFTVELDGNLPSGESIQEAIEKIDKETNGYPLYYMINCAHPTHFISQLEKNGKWKNRIQGLRANASCKSHAELDEATELDRGNVAELGVLHEELQARLPNLKVFGGCCGTDAGHVASICNHIL